MQYTTGTRGFNYQIQFSVGVVQPRYSDPAHPFNVRLSDKALLCAGYMYRLNADRHQECTTFCPLYVFGRQFRFEQPSEDDAVAYLSECLTKNLARATVEVVDHFKRRVEETLM